jgi:hypothetical protein
MVTIKCVNGPIVVGYKFMQAGEQREVSEAIAAEAKAQYGDAVWLPGDPEPLQGVTEQTTDGVLTSSHALGDDMEWVAPNLQIQNEVTVLEANPNDATVNEVEVTTEPNEVQDGDSLRNPEEPAAKRSSRPQRNTKR